MPVDSRGIAWDKRFYTSTKSKHNDGSWKVKRDVDKAALKLYEAGQLVKITEQPVVEQPVVEQPVVEQYVNTRPGKYQILDIVWNPGESLSVPESMRQDKRFLHAVSMGHLERV